ncbi:putative signal transduction protein [Escherichia coli]|uniref:Putative signal transduction protein n=1 Tax=Escherichia coli TaxID=562 RepID=A0A376KQQ8_ECOLX|nr:putative signal transduction protein [Escherichia coli]
MERCVVRIFTGRHEWNCRWPALLLPDERTYAPRQRNHDRHQARTILRGVSTGGGYTSFASNGPGSTCYAGGILSREKFPPDAFINFAESQKMIVPLTQHLFELIARDAAELEKSAAGRRQIWALTLRRTICTAKALKQISRNCSLPYPHTISRLCWKLPSAIC